MPRPFIYTADAESLRETGQPSTPLGLPVFNQLLEQTKTLIESGAGPDRSGLQPLIAQKLNELATARFAARGADVPEGFPVSIEEDAEAIASAISESLSFVILATIFNVVGTVDGQGNPILSYANTPADADSPQPVPLVAGAGKVPFPL